MFVSQMKRTVTSSRSSGRMNTTCILFFLIATMFVCIDSHAVIHATSKARKYLSRMHSSTETALKDHLTANLCEPKKNCTVLNPSLEIDILPKCQISGGHWYNRTRINYSSIQSYQGYLLKYLGMSESKSLLSNKTLAVLEDVIGAFEALVLYMPEEVKCRSGNELNEGTFNEEIPKISNNALAKARLYVFLHQYKDFLSCFKASYRKHFPSENIGRC